MDILYVTDFLPHPKADGGGRKMFDYYMRTMVSKGHNVSVLSILHAGDEAFINDVRQICRSVTGVYANPSVIRRGKRLLKSNYKPVEYAFCDSIGILPVARQLLAHEQFDVIHVVQPCLINVVHRSVEAIPRKPRIVGHAIDVVTKLAFRKMNLVNGLRRIPRMLNYALTSITEFSDLGHCDHIMTHSRSDAEYIRAMLSTHVPITLSPVWFDAMDAILPILHNAHPGTDLLYVGNSADTRSRQAIDWFITKVLPKVRQHVPGAILHIVSVRPKHMPLWRDIAGVVCHGYVESLLPLYDTSAVFVAPLFTGGGQHLKVLNAFARGCPTVMTSIANDGIAAMHNQEALIADTSENFTDSIIKLLMDPSLSIKIAGGALHKVKSIYRTVSITNTLEEAYGIRSITSNNPYG